MECPGDLAWLCTMFPALLPAVAMLFQGGALEAKVDHAIWATSYGAMQTAVVGETFVARYPETKGVIVGQVVEGRHVVGVWVQPESERQCTSRVPDVPDDERPLLDMMGVSGDSPFWGRISFVIPPDRATFQGQWSYCGDPMGRGGIWNGSLETREVRTLRRPG